MSGLLNMGPQDEALLALGLGLLNSKGSFGNALGQAGMQSLQTLNQAKEREQLAKQRAQQEEMQRMQAEQMRRQATLDAMTPTMRKPDFMDNRDVGSPGETQPSPDLAGLAQQYMMAPGGLQRGLQLQEMLKKQKPAPLKVGANDRVLDPETFKELVPALPDKDAGSPLAKLIAERDKFPPGHPARKVYDNAITKATTHQPGVSVSYGAPVAGVDADGKPVFFQPDKSGGAPSIIPGVAPPKQPVPAALQEKLAQNAVTLQKIDKAIELVAKNPDSFGLQNVLGDQVMQRVDPTGVEARAMVADIGGQKIHDRSGAAVTVGESERLKPYIPNANDRPETVKKKLKLFKAEYQSMMQAINSGASAAQAAKPAASAPAKEVKRTGTFNGRKVVEYSDGSVEYVD
jgi:hypothetical protein